MTLPTLPTVAELAERLRRINATHETTGPWGERTATAVRLSVAADSSWDLVSALVKPAGMPVAMSHAEIPGYGRRFAARRVAGELLAGIRRGLGVAS